jgi:hypothetical protein
MDKERRDRQTNTKARRRDGKNDLIEIGRGGGPEKPLRQNETERVTGSKTETETDKVTGKARRRRKRQKLRVCERERECS